MLCSQTIEKVVCCYNISILLQRLLPVISRDIHHFINTISYLRVDDARHPNLHVSQEIKDAIKGRLEILTDDFFVAVAFHFFSEANEL